MVDAYKNDLAYIHDAGFGHFARAAAPAVLELLRKRDKPGGLVVNLGCGSGIEAEIFAAAGYDVVGIDLSESMVALARRRVPRGEFRTGSLLDADIPPCVAVTAVGECFNYLFDTSNTERKLVALLRRIHAALEPGGLLVFDVATPGRAPGPVRNYREGEDWAVLFEAEEDRQRRRLTRRITSFRKVGTLYRRDHEVHCLRLLTRGDMTKQLRGVGFRVRTLAAYGPVPFPAGRVGFVARKS